MTLFPSSDPKRAICLSPAKTRDIGVGRIPRHSRSMLIFVGKSRTRSVPLFALRPLGPRGVPGLSQGQYRTARMPDDTLGGTPKKDMG